MATRFLYCHSSVVCGKANMAFPGIARFSRFFDLYGGWVLPVDRTGTVRTPVKTLSLAPLTPFKPFKKTYQEICDTRAKEVLAQADKLDSDMYVFYSGGIDSTCVLLHS